MNLYQSGSRLISKFCNLIGTEQFGPYTRTRFSKVWYLSRNTANNIHFHYEPNSEKTNDQTFQYNQKSHSLAHFQLSSAQLFWHFFSKDMALSFITSFGFLIIHFQENIQTDGWWIDQQIDPILFDDLNWCKSSVNMKQKCQDTFACWKFNKENLETKL